MYAAGVIAVYALIIIMELTPFWKDKKRKHIFVYLIFMGGSLIISVSLVSGVQFPTISSILTRILYGK